MKGKLYNSVWIESQFGSSFQAKFAKETLVVLLNSWRNQLHISHKKNHIEIMVDAEKLDDILTDIIVSSETNSRR